MSVRSSRLSGAARAALLTALLLPVATPVLAQSAPQDPEEAAPVTRLDEIIVTGAPFGISRRATTIATSVIDEEALAIAPASSIGDLLSGEPGLRSTNFAPGASRPVIRGLSGPRVQVLTNGIGLIDASSVSPDHQVATDPGEANRIEIVRGPATLSYGGSAIGGVVNVLDGRIPEERPENGLEGSLSVQGSTVDQGRALSGRVNVAIGNFVFHVDGVKKETDDYDIPAPAISERLAAADSIVREDTGTLPNSNSELEAWGIGGSYIGENGFLGLSYKETASLYGVVAEDSVFIDLEQQRFDARGAWRFDTGPFREVQGAYGHADYTHTEFEDVGEPGTIFNSDGQEGRVDLIQRERDGWNGAVGVQGLSRTFEAIGEEAFVPGTEIGEAGIYTVQRLDRDGYGFEGGLRYDRRTVTATPLSGGSEIERSFDNWSASGAVFVRPASNLFLGLSLSRTERAPSEVELFADGVHVATAAYEQGDVTLDSERVTTLEGTVHYDRGAFRGDLHVYAADYDGFIDQRDTGTEFYFAEEDEYFPIFAYVQTGAEFRGFEAEAAYDVWSSGAQAVTLEGAADYVDAKTDLGPAARIPPYSVTGRIRYTSTPADLSLEVHHVGEQDDVAEFELPTDGYTMVNLSGAWRPMADSGVTVFAELHNIGDVEAREHVSFLKDIAPMPGRNLRVGLAWRF
jgi:iron complex outermembrane recepter protein